MNKQQRQEYRKRCGPVEDDDDICYVLCSFCRFAQWEAEEVECWHPLDVVQARVPDVYTLCADCWGFRPKPDCRIAVLDQTLAGWAEARREEREDLAAKE